MMRQSKVSSTLLLLLLGVAIRVPSLLSPLEEGHRNAQTAVLTAGMVQEDCLRLDPIAPWRGDLEARVVQELPIYNLAVIGIVTATSMPLDTAGRLTSLIFWILSFIALQALWKRTLPDGAKFWANFLFIFSPMGWYLSTAFMPESLLQLLSIVFLSLSADYAEHARLKCSVFLASVAVLGLLVKLPAFAHLGLFAVCVIADRQGWRGLARIRIFVVAAISIACLVSWSAYVSHVNEKFFPYWAGAENLYGFIQPHVSRFSPNFWLSLAAYNVAFVIPLTAVPFAAVGFAAVVRAAHDSFEKRIWIYLAGSLVFYWLLWAKGAAAQNYYNLPNLVLFSAIFGLGMDKSATWLRSKGSPEITIPFAQNSAAVALVALCWAGCLYLSRPDTATVNAARWINTNTKPEDLLLYQPLHSAAVMDYEHQPLLSHLTGRRTWIWTRSTPEWEKSRAKSHSAYLVITLPPSTTSFPERIRRFFKGPPAEPPTRVNEREITGAKLVRATSDFAAYVMVGH